MVTWRKLNRWVRYVNGQMVALSRSESGFGTYTDAVTTDGPRLTVEHLNEWAAQEFAGIPTRVLDTEDGLIGICLGVYL
jgi:hypothetical protein